MALLALANRRIGILKCVAGLIADPRDPEFDVPLCFAEPRLEEPSTTPVDEHVDLPTYRAPHLKVELGTFVTMSTGIEVTGKS